MGTVFSKRADVILGAAMVLALSTLANAQPDLSTVEGRYTHVTSKLDAGGVYFHYVDLDGLADLYFEAGEKFLAAIQEQASDPEVQTALGQVLEKGGPIYNYLGITAIQGFGSSSVPDGDGYLTKSFLALDSTKHTDRPKVLIEGPRARRGLHLAPKETQAFFSFDASVRNAIQIVYDIAAITHPDVGARQLDQGFEMAQAFTTIPWKQSLESLEGEMVLAAWADGDEWRTMDDADEPFEYPVVHYLAALQTTDSALADGILNWAQMQTFKVETTELGEATVSTLVPPEFLKGAPQVSIARDETFTYFASAPGLIADAMGRLQQETGGLVDSAEFQRMREGFPLECNSIAYFDQSANEILLEMSRRNAAEDEAAMRMMESLKELGESIAKPMSTMAVAVHEPDGISWYSRGPSSARANGAMFVAAGAGMLTAISVPGFLRAREISRRNACQENQSKLDGAVTQYMLENRLPSIDAAIDEIGVMGQTEDNRDVWVGTLVGEDSYLRFSPVCPSGGLYSLVKTGESGFSTPCVSCSLKERPDVDRAFWHVFPGTDMEY
jgi:hypothetical protein